MAQSSVFRGTARNIVKAPTCTLFYYHNTAVVVVGKDGRITLNANGYRTATTKLAMNQVSNQYAYGFKVFQGCGQWYVQFTDKSVMPFEDGMTFTVAQARCEQTKDRLPTLAEVWAA